MCAPTAARKNGSRYVTKHPAPEVLRQPEAGSLQHSLKMCSRKVHESFL
jgi:hypothetical protein